MLNGCFQAHIPCDLVRTCLWLPLGLMALFGAYTKNVNGQLQFASGVVLQAIGHYVYTLTDAIKWVDCGSWLSQPEGVKSVILEAYPEHWLVLSTLMVYTWRIAEQYRQ